MQSEQLQSPLPKLILNVAFGSYSGDQQSLLTSIRAVGEDAPVRLFTSEVEVGAPPHQPTHHYVFKPYAFRKVEGEGARLVLWLDARIRVIRPLTWIWEAIEKQGYFFIDNGANVGSWSSDDCLAYFGISREQALDTPELTGCVIGLDLLNPVASRFLDEWQLAAVNGAFGGDWCNDKHQVSTDDRVKGHRHDQTCASIIAHQLGMTTLTRDVLWYYQQDQKPPETAFFVNGGP